MTGISLTSDERNLLLADSEFSSEVLKFLEGNETIEAREFAKTVIQTKEEYPDFKIDVVRSYKSPYIVDLDDVKPSLTNPEPEKVKFMYIYDKLLQTSFFKDVITDVFDVDSTKMNVKFTIVEGLVVEEHDPNGSTEYSINTGENALVNNLITIKIDKAYLETQPLIRVAKTIVHEVVHTHLALLYINSPYVTQIGDYSPEEFAALLDEVFENDEAEHEFIAQHYIPTMSKAVEEILPLVEPQRKIEYLDTIFLFDEIGTNLGEWDWSDFYKYLSWSGLYFTEYYNEQIQNNNLNEDLYQAYSRSSTVLEENNQNKFETLPVNEI